MAARRTVGRNQKYVRQTDVKSDDAREYGGEKYVSCQNDQTHQKASYPSKPPSNPPKGIPGGSFAAAGITDVGSGLAIQLIYCQLCILSSISGLTVTFLFDVLSCLR